MKKLRPKRCGCTYDGPVQVLTCGEHNVAAKNLDRAQVLIVEAGIERENLLKKIMVLEALTSKEPKPSVVEWEFDKTLSWACGVVLNGIGEGKLQGAVASVILHVNNVSYHRGKRDGMAFANSSKKRRRS